LTDPSDARWWTARATTFYESQGQNFAKEYFTDALFCGERAPARLDQARADATPRCSARPHTVRQAKKDAFIEIPICCRFKMWEIVIKHRLRDSRQISTKDDDAKLRQDKHDQVPALGRTFIDRSPEQGRLHDRAFVALSVIGPCRWGAARLSETSGCVEWTATGGIEMTTDEGRKPEGAPARSL